MQWNTWRFWQFQSFTLTCVSLILSRLAFFSLSFQLLDSFSNLPFCPFLLASFKSLAAACQRRGSQLPQELRTHFLFLPFTPSAIFFSPFLKKKSTKKPKNNVFSFSETWSYVGFTWYFLQAVFVLFYLGTPNSPTLIFFIDLLWEYWN